MRKADKEGPFGKAWRLPLSGPSTALGSWLVFAPKSHLLWPYKMIALCHLRDVPGVPPAHKQYPQAEYELMVISINPEDCPEPDPEKYEDGYPLLYPVDVVTQFHGIPDRDAVTVLDSAINAVVSGQLVPDQDYRRMWDSSVASTVAHFISGAHRLN